MFTEAQAQQAMLDKLPPGFAWTRQTASNFGRLMAPAADEQVAFEESAEAQLIEGTPSTADQLIPDYQRVLGPDPCLGRPTNVPVALAVLQQSVHARWTEVGGASRPHFTLLAAALGAPIVIEEFRPLKAGFRAGSPCYPHAVFWTWRVHAPPASAAGQAWLICNLSRRSPADTTLVVAFDGDGVSVGAAA